MKSREKIIEQEYNSDNTKNTSLNTPQSEQVKDDKDNPNKIEEIADVKSASKDKKGKKKDKSDKPKKKGFKRFIPIMLTIVIAVISGAGLGYWYYDSSKIDDTIYDKYNEADLVDDQKSVIGNILGVANMSEDQLANSVKIAKERGINPSKLKAVQNIAFAQYNLSKATSFEAFGVGNVDTIANQTIYSVKKFNGETYTFESISKGTLTIADLSVYQKDSTSVNVVKGTNIQEDSAVWNGKKTNYSASEFKNLAGNLPSTVIPYIISSKTIESETKPIESQSEDGKKLYTFTVNLDKVKGAVNYCRQVKMTSGLEKRPLFEDIKLTFTIDENWNFVQYEVEEHYSVFYIVPAKCTGTLVTTFKINEEITLPEYTL